MKTLRIATRQSPLALWQAEHVAARLRERFPEQPVELLPMSTRGDQLLQTSLARLGGKNLFIKELEQALLEGRADLAVHSMKDVGADLAPEFVIAAILPRDNPHDALVSNHFSSLEALPAGARVGTCSLRRQMQLRRLRPDLRLLDLRGNVQTRLNKLDAGEFDAIILACAGLRRLGLEKRIGQELHQLIPAAGQGAIGIECRADAPVRALLQQLEDESTARCVRAERAIAARLGASCSVPLAAYAEALGGEIRLETLLARPDGRDALHRVGQVPAAEALPLAERFAEEFLAAGAGAILADL